MIFNLVRTLGVTALFFSLAIPSFAGVESVKDSIGTQMVAGKKHVRYLVSPGETIYRISTNYGVPISDLMEINPELENGLKVGQVILIPYKEDYLEAMKAKNNPGNKDKKVHVVQPGETLYSLSKKYNVSIGELLKWNGMELKAGQELVVGVDNEETTVVTKTEEREKEVLRETKEEKKSVEKVVKKESKPKKEEEATEDEPYEAYETTYHKINYDPDYKQVLVIPFDPHLYFSDADDEIAQRSGIHRTKVRMIFRKRLNALLDPKGYETIRLIGGSVPDSLSDLNRAYSSVSYDYMEPIQSEYYKDNLSAEKTETEEKKSFKEWLTIQKDKVMNTPGATTSSKAAREGDKGRYFGVKVRDPEFFEYFGTKYSTDFYIFVNQFEVVTDYEHCLDRAAQNYQRYFITHYSIFNHVGEQIAGNKFKVYYNSNSNYIWKIVADNMHFIAERIMAELPGAHQVKAEELRDRKSEE